MTPAVLQFEFVAPGNSAPVPLAPDALWVDVGNGGDDAVLDHHQGGAADSAAAMVLGRAPLLLRRFGGLPAVRVTTHRRPDLDAVTACWLVSCLLRRGALPCGAAQLAAEVSRHDQGREGHHGDAASDLGLVMAVALEAAGDDLARLDAGFAVLDRVAGQMEAGVA
ncbi:MAG TPA: hypothetical protein VK196_16165, partial [Magnetospirillum sp.]|nr:hypothetical protein [Magnetospirillum sp.]